MPSYYPGSLWPTGRPQAGPATRGLVAALVVCSLAASLWRRQHGMGEVPLIFDGACVLEGQVWRLVSYAFVKTTNPLALLLSAAVLWLFGCAYEKSWGSWGFLRFFLLSTVGAAALCLPLSALSNWVLPFDDLARAEGPDAAIDAMLVAMAYNAPNANVMFGFVLPMRARSLVALLLGMQVVAGIMTGAATLGMTLGGMVMGYFLISGAWRPRRWRTGLNRWRTRRRRRRLTVASQTNWRHLN